jgi:hypothetical protein
MLSSITPLGERGKGNRWSVTAGAYIVGSAVGGAALGLLAGGVGFLLTGGWSATTALVLLAVACLGAAAWDLSGRSVPSWRRQVDEQWLQAFRGWVYGFGFGVQLGAGVVTIITSAATWAAVAAMLLSGSVAGGAVVGLAFGLARGLVLLGVRHVDSIDELTRFHRRLEQGSGRARRLTVVTLALGGVAAAFLGVGA